MKVELNIRIQIKFDKNVTNSRKKMGVYGTRQ